MSNDSKVAKAIRRAMMFGAAATASVSTSAFSAEEGAEEEIEKIEVTGSRIKRADLEGASPVTVLTLEDMKMEGNFTVADALRGSSFNSFGSFSERSGSSAQSQATVNLRGAGSNRTLVLLDGKRMPGSPTMGGQSANLNAIPMAAVERIEILTDGASSTYGSDAIAGVVNVILKKNYEGLSFNIGAGQRTQDEGTTSSEFSILGGLSNDKGNITFAFDHQKRKGISDGDREYTKANAQDFNGDGIITSDETSGWSTYGATVYDTDRANPRASKKCGELSATNGEDVFRKFDAANGVDSYCMFAYANVSYNTASIDRNTVFVDANYEITDDVEWFGRAMFVQNQSFGRYAPPAANWNNPSAEHIPDGMDPADVGYMRTRWVDIGNRDGTVDDYNQDYLTGLRGDLDWNNATWEVYYHRNVADNKSVGQYYLSYGGLAYNESNADYIESGSDQFVDNIKATTLQNSTSTFDQFNVGLGFDLFSLPAGDIAHFVGAEYMEQNYADIYDAQSEAGLIGGSAGNSAMGSRDITAIFYEAAIPVTDSIEVNLAARYDDYSDFGSNVAPKASIRWELLEGLVVRASYSEAFRAPGLDELNAADTFSAESATDFAYCQSTGTACTSEQYDTYYRSNPDLGAETSEYTNLGVAWDITDDMGLKVDYFQLTIDNAITTKSVQSLLTDEAQGEITAIGTSDVPTETFYLMRNSQGSLVESGTGYYNTEESLQIEGVDITFNAGFITSFGDFRFNLINSFVLEYGSDLDEAGTAGAPDHKMNGSLSWTLGDHSLAWASQFTASTSEFDVVNSTTGQYDSTGELDSWLIHHLTYTYDAGKYGAVTLQVNNLTDEDPVLSSFGTWDDQDLYNNFGRDLRASYSISF
jgi:iron complex outermembrane receptor protein